MKGFPEEIILEVTNFCNEACVMCHFHGEGVRRRRPLGHMPPAVWERVLQEAADRGQPLQLVTHGAGEPLLYPHLVDLLRAALTVPHLTVGFMTNGMALNETMADALLNLGVHWVAFSVDGVDPEMHARYRKGSNLHRIESNLKRFIAMKKQRGLHRPAVAFNMVCLPELAEQEEAYVRRWLPDADRVMVSFYRPVGHRRLPEAPRPFPRRPCPFLWRQLVVTWSGEAALCCEDIHCEVPLGKVGPQSVEEIWNGKPLADIRRAHEKGAYHDVPFCLPCDTWAAHEVLQRERTSFGVCETTRVQRIYTKRRSLVLE